jgi:outer membrane protein assembly factor BamB
MISEFFSNRSTTPILNQMQNLKLLFVALALGFVSVQPAMSEDWPQWRGPRGDGTTKEKGIPVRWDIETGENIVWKTELPGKGHSSPIVWKDRIFITTCIEAEQQRELICLDTQTGRQLWHKSILKSPLETVHKLNSHASGTPATDGELIFVAFLQIDGKTIPAPNVGAPRDVTPGRIVLTAVDLSGEQRWQVDVGDFVSAHGFCSCPVLYQNLVIINGDHDGQSYLVALDRLTGSEVWRTPREQGIRSYVTPIIRTINNRDQLVLSGSGHIASFDPANGEMIWKVEGPTEQYVASMVYDGQRFFMAAGFPTHHVMAIDPNGAGDVTNSHVVWHIDKYVRCYVPSPVLVGMHLFVADDRGTASCFASNDGTRLWQDRLSGSFNASLVATEDLAYFLSGDGVMRVVSPTEEFAVVAENNLGEACDASPAISNGQIYIRGEKHLFRIGSVAN